MELLDCYRLLGLTPHASLAEVKASYRRLARRLHPDLNPGLPHDPFVRLHQAYQVLLEVAPATPPISQGPVPTTAPPVHPATTPPPRAPQEAAPQPASPFRHHPQLSPFERQLKSQAYYRLQGLLSQGKFAYAIALVEGLSQRLAVDLEVRQWQAVTYQRVARHAMTRGEFRKAHIYLKKALRTDPNNRSLRQEVEGDFQQLQQQVRQRARQPKRR
ncbi:J domain-containing protein [Sodalinema gerasimenkoae]|uniref:J domain-containing protein n=1 Tax=Sodalinema gerasimenkoae TaxID=2862348 RepID=UPI0013591FE4|nr:J domain-containing protein [Sodalinema gerasimenkoae]